jgi:hypothetical protein
MHNPKDDDRLTATKAAAAAAVRDVASARAKFAALNRRNAPATAAVTAAEAASARVAAALRGQDAECRANALAQGPKTQSLRRCNCRSGTSGPTSGGRALCRVYGFSASARISALKTLIQSRLHTNRRCSC